MSKTLTLKSIRNAATNRPAGYVGDVLSQGTVEGDRVTLSDEAYAMLVAKYRPTVVPKAIKERPLPPPPGPGTELKALLKKVGINPSPNCSCNARAKRMDEMEQKEPGWCESHIEEIVGWLREEATKRKLPFIDAAGRLLVRRAIANARRKSALTK